MLQVDDYARIRLSHRDGMGIRALARKFGHSRQTIREVLSRGAPRPYTLRAEREAPKLGPFHEAIDEILRMDETQPSKQRHTAARIFRRLKEENGYLGGYAQVQRYVATHRRRDRETFIPLEHGPGRRLEFDFGEIQVDFPQGRRKVSVLIGTWAHSYAAFAIALPTQRTEAILHGMVSAFEHFECVPREVWWDNPKTVAVEIFRGRDRRVNQAYQELASHYNFAALFCMPARGNEKPHVENRVKWLEREWATPVPRVGSLEELNALLRARCQEDRGRVATGQTATIGARFDQERSAAAALPTRRFEPCITRAAQTDKYQTVRFDKVMYSVPRNVAFQNVTVKAFVDRVEIVWRNTVVARHQRSYESDLPMLDPRHYLATLTRKPACLDHAPVYRDWDLPAVFARLREALETREGRTKGVRQFIRVLQLLREHPVERLAALLEEVCPANGAAPRTLSVDAIILRAGRIGAEAQRETLRETDLPASVPVVQVPAPNLHRFNQLLTPGEICDVDSVVVAQDQPQAAAVAHDVCGV